MNRYCITTPIYYVNDRPHIGHAYTSLACDVLARFQRLSGHRVFFLTGTDEHGQKVEKSAKALGISPQAMADANSAYFRDMMHQLSFSNDDFIRTTESRHVASAQALWQRMQANGHIYLGSYSGWYSVRDEAYYQESELINGKAPTGADVEWVEEPSYFFRLSSFADDLIAYYNANPSFIGPESRRNEIIRFVEGGLKDLSISRTTFSWGIPVPGDSKHIMYVWLDALANYLSALGFPDEQHSLYKDFWPADLHMVGKDIIRFHAVYWPAFLMAAQLPLPKRIYAHGWWTIEGEKMSKSLGNAIAPASLVEEFGLDQTRYFLMREVPFGSDGNFSRQGMINRINSELANNLGNLAQRTLSIISKNCGGIIPTPSELTAIDEELVEKANNLIPGQAFGANSYHDLILSQQFHLALEKIVSVGNDANAYIDSQAPWKLKKENPERMNTVLYVLYGVIRKIAYVLQPFAPASSHTLMDQLSIPDNERDFSYAADEFAPPPGTALPPPQPVFLRFTERAA